MRLHLFRRTDFLAFLFVSAVYLVAIVPAPGVSLPDANYDDGLFMKWTVSILNGKWLGPWDVLTASKGPLHSLLTAAAATLGVNPFAYKRLFYLFGSLIFIGTGLKKAPAWLKLLTLVTLLLDPFQYSGVGLRNLREGTYIPLQLIAFGLGSWSLDLLREQSRMRALLVAAIIGTATCFGLILVTREARIVAWIEMFTWLLIGVFLVAWRQRHQLNRRLGIKILASLLSVLAIIGWTNIPVIALSTLNSSYYGANISNNFEEGAFPALYGKLLSIRIKGQAYMPRVHVSQLTMEGLINEAVPGGPLSKMLKSIDSGIWGKTGCAIYPQTCGEIVGGWFIWAVRQGIGVSLEPGANEDSFQAMIQYVNSELDGICKRTSNLICSIPQAGYLPPLSRWGYLRPIMDSAKEASRIGLLVLIPSVYPLRQWESPLGVLIPSAYPLDQVERRLGIRRAKLSELLMWYTTNRVASTLGASGKWAMLVMSVVSVCLAAVRLRLLRLLDLVFLWMLLSLCTHLLLNTFLGLTSFPGETYAIMASPLFICLLARLLACLMPFIHVNPPLPHSPQGNSSFST